MFELKPSVSIIKQQFYESCEPVEMRWIRPTIRISKFVSEPEVRRKVAPHDSAALAVALASRTSLSERVRSTLRHRRRRNGIVTRLLTPQASVIPTFAITNSSVVKVRFVKGNFCVLRPRCWDVALREIYCETGNKEQVRNYRELDAGCIGAPVNYARVLSQGNDISGRSLWSLLSL